MLTQEKINKIYDLAIFDEKILKNSILSLDLRQRDIMYLEENKILKREDDYYIFINYNKLVGYGKYLALNNQTEKAIKCFDKCILNNSNNTSLRFKIFEASLMCGDYKKSFDYYKPIYNEERSDNRFILYLLNLITDLDEEYKNKVKSFKYKMLKEEDNEKNIEINKVRKYAYDYNFHEALNIMFKNKKNMFSRYDSVLVNLFKIAQNEISKRKKVLFELIKDNEYESAQYYLSNLKEDNRANNFFRKSLYIVNTVLDIRTNKTIPLIKVPYKKSLYGSIENNDFIRALYISQSRAKNLFEIDNDILIHLLIDVNKEINIVSEKKNNNIVLSKKKNYN